MVPQSSMMRSLGRLLTVLILCLHKGAAGQFVTPIPKALSGKVAESADVFGDSHFHEDLQEIYGECDRKLPDNEPANRICRTAPPNVQTLRNDIKQYCESLSADPKEQAACEGVVDPKDVLKEKIIGIASWQFPLGLGTRGLRQLYAATGDFTLLSGFGANLGDDQAFVLSDLLTGAIGALPFALTTATIVSVNDTGSSKAQRDTLSSLASDLARAINNGGSVSARLVAPLVIYRGPTLSFSQSAYMQLGLLGPLTDTKQLNGSATFVTEAVLAAAVRKPASAEHIGDFLVGGRVGLAWKGASFSPGIVDRHHFYFAQVGIGFRKDDQLGLAALITFPLNAPDVTRYVPRLLVNLSSLRL